MNLLKLPYIGLGGLSLILSGCMTVIVKDKSEITEPPELPPINVQVTVISPPVDTKEHTGPPPKPIVKIVTKTAPICSELIELKQSSPFKIGEMDLSTEASRMALLGQMVTWITTVNGKLVEANNNERCGNI